MIADRFQAPVGNDSTLLNGLWVPYGKQPKVGKWRSVNDFANYYYLGPGTANPALHTGVDLNLTLETNYDADAHAPVYAVTNGVVIFAERVFNSTWGNLIVLEHQLSDGSRVYSRYGHVESMLVTKGAVVAVGTQIASVGNSFGRFPYHLHFDISPTSQLKTSPTDWPGTSKLRLTSNYIDPYQFLQGRIMSSNPIPVQEEILYVQAKDGLNLRAIPSPIAAKIRPTPMPFGTKVHAFDSADGGGYHWRRVTVDSTQETGWAAERTSTGIMYLASSDPLPMKTATKYTAVNLRLRVSASLAGTPIMTIPAGTKLTLTGGPILASGYVWWRTTLPSGQSGYAAEKSTDGTSTFMVDSLPTPPPPQPSTKIVHGFHIHQGFQPHVPSAVKQLAQTGKMACAVVINDGAISNMLVQNGVKYVLHRVWANEGMPRDLDGGPDDESRGKDWWSNHKHAFDGLDPRIYLQIQNEQNHPADGYYYLGVMKAADADGRKIAIFSDSVGNPSDVHEENGKFVSAVWSRRVASGAMRYGKDHNHIVCLHQYGRVTSFGKETSDPGCAIWPDGRRDDEAYKWFGGRHVGVWRDIIPADSRMPIVIGECGPSDAIYRGTDQVLNELKGYQERYGADPYILGYAFWTFGGAGDFGFGYSTIDASSADILAFIANA